MADTFQRASVALANTNTTEVFQVPNATADERVLVIGLNVCNVSVDAATVIVSIVNAAGATISRYAHQESIAANSRKELIDGNGKLVLLNGERLRVAASVGNALEVTASYVLNS